jgi:micrococcal nuclease
LKAGSCLMILLSCLFLFAVAPVSAKSEQAPINTLEGLVVGLSEGDQITVNSFGTEIKVRLYGIVAPQIAKVDKFSGWSKAGQPYGEEAFRALSIKILHQQVKVEIRSTLVHKGDDKQLALAVVYLDGRNINMEMVSDGWAWAYKKVSNKEDFPKYQLAEKQARAKRKGLWVQGIPQPPWEFQPLMRIKPKLHGK